ncbi:cell division protein FtsQ [Mycobacterium sp. MS1601]|uniref:cell division protein FtsQ/DivIB n=1 Tax=Mycobacterium sp. MS1601 TaxID=1936029 RepID=UPI0009794A67|nr:cell division protein FtsQ [Mycobacterium sp. MS1601]
MTGPQDRDVPQAASDAGAQEQEEPVTPPSELSDSSSVATSTHTAEEPGDLEGPRRRERRERAERREAENRAKAIEEARRDAKRKAQGAPSVDIRPPRRGTVRGLKVVLWTIGLVVLATGLGLALYVTPLMSARDIVVVGAQEITRDEVIATSQVTEGTPLLQINTDVVAQRVAAIRRVASARVQREYPSTLRITIVERIPIAVKDFPDGPHLYDRDGVDFATGPAPLNLPYLDVENPAPSDLPTQAALAVLTALRPEVAGQVGRVAAPSVASITLTLTDGRVVVWGTEDRTQEKADKLAALLTQPGQTYDVSSPDLPTVK